MNKVNELIEKSRLTCRTQLSTEKVVDLRKNWRRRPLYVENDLEKAIKEILLYEMKHECTHEFTFPLMDMRDWKGRFRPKSRSPDFLLPQVKVNGRYVDLDPHHFGTDDEGKASPTDVQRWIDFKTIWGKDIYIVFISHNSQEEVERQTGTKCGAFCDAFLCVGKRGEKTEKEVKQTIKKMLVGLIARSEKEGGYWGSCDEAYDREFKGLLERAERGRKVQTYLNERGNRSFEAGVTILGAIRNK